MEFFGLTLYGPQNYIKDTLNEGYVEPEKKKDVEPLLKRIQEATTLPSKVNRTLLTLPKEYLPNILIILRFGIKMR